MKEEFNKNAQRAIFDLEKTQARFQLDKENLEGKVEAAQDKQYELQNKVNELRDTIEVHLDEISRLKTTIVNKDSHNQSLEDML